MDKKRIMYIAGIIMSLMAGFGVSKVDIDGYDANDGIYKFIPEAPKDWTEKFGANERTRLIHSISELRVVVSNQSQILMKLTDPNTIK